MTITSRSATRPGPVKQWALERSGASGLSSLRAIAVPVLLLWISASCGQSRVPPPVEAAKGEVTPDVVFVPTPHRVVDQMLSVARVGRDDVLYDLGSGDGRIVIAAARRFGTRGVGIDIDPKRIIESQFNADTARVAELVEFRQTDLFTTDLRPATVVTLYLLPQLNVRLRPKLFDELRPGSRIVSHSFDMGDWKADSTLLVDGRIVYFWIIPANVAGDWDLEASMSEGVRRHDIRLDQKYQWVGNAQVAGSAQARIEDVTVRGENIAFLMSDSAGGRASSLAFMGRVAGDSMTGTFTDRSGTPRQWKAVRRSQ